MTEQSGLLEQKAALDEVSRLLYVLIAPGDTELQWRVRGINVVTSEAQIFAFNPDGQYETPEGRVNSPRTSFALYTALDKLRASMYREGAGTWFSALFRVSPEGSATAEFDYDNEPQWNAPPAPSSYVADLETYPRDADHIPAWLAEQVAAAGAS